MLRAYCPLLVTGNAVDGDTCFVCPRVAGDVLQRSSGKNAKNGILGDERSVRVNVGKHSIYGGNGRHSQLTLITGERLFFLTWEKRSTARHQSRIRHNPTPPMLQQKVHGSGGENCLLFGALR